MASRIHLIRHGEVENPQHLVYASLPGFGLSEEGESQSREVARYLGRAPLVAIWSSPLERALRTAEPLAARVGIPVRLLTDVVEWSLMDRWRGTVWEELPDTFPGELEGYLEDPSNMPYSPESLGDLASRMARALRDLDQSYPHGDVAVVSHAGPVRAAVLALTGSPLGGFWEDQPEHGSVTTFAPQTNGPWKIETVWAPDSD